MRPPAILYFERLYLASLGLSVIGWAISWPVLSARMAVDPRTAGFGWLLPAGLALSVAISLALWFFVARRASRIARTIAVVLTALSVLRLLLVREVPVPTTDLLDWTGSPFNSVS